MLLSAVQPISAVMQPVQAKPSMSFVTVLRFLNHCMGRLPLEARGGRHWTGVPDRPCPGSPRRGRAKPGCDGSSAGTVASLREGSILTIGDRRAPRADGDFDPRSADRR